MSTYKSIPNLKGILPTLSVRELESLPKPVLDPDFLEKTEAYPHLEQQVVVHCRFRHSVFYFPQVRIWPSTFLIPKDSSSTSRLLQTFNISFYPEWTEIKPHKIHEFTLIFEGLPKDCTAFDLVEEIPEPGGFYVVGIARNPSDVYHIEL